MGGVRALDGRGQLLWVSNKDTLLTAKSERGGAYNYAIHMNRYSSYATVHLSFLFKEYEQLLK